MTYKRKRQPAGPQPKEFLRFAEEWAIRMRKLTMGVDHSAPVGDVMQILTLIEQLAKKGQSASAVAARGLAGKVEILFDLVRTELTDCP